MGEDVDRAELERLRSRTSWVGEADAACAAAPGGHLEVVLEPGEVPRCTHCGTTLSPDALRRAGIRGRKA